MKFATDNAVLLLSCIAASVAAAGFAHLPFARKLVATTTSVMSAPLSGVRDDHSASQPGHAVVDHMLPSTAVVPDPIASPSLTGLPAIKSNFDSKLGLRPNGGTGDLPKSGAPDVVGAFRFICRPGQIAMVDPIVNPGPRGTKSNHLHQFFGNTRVYSDSTYASLRAEGGSTCNEVGDPFAPGALALNRSAYWQPAMLNGKGSVVRPDWVSIYYKRRPATDPIVSDPSNPRYMGQAVDLPNGLRFIFGRDMLDLSKPSTGGFRFNCTLPSGQQTEFDSLGKAIAACPLRPDASGRMASVTTEGEAPACWDGKRLDSPNHRDHVAYPSYGTWGYLKCPATHPYVIPFFTMKANFTLDADALKWSLSSDAMAPGQPVGSTYHADFFMAWDPITHRMFHDHCINKLLSCSGGDLGNGQQLRGSWAVKQAEPRLVPIPVE
ncbi:hypothetical protein GGQ97_000300 [Sphingomonas kaistensis]|uniref:DUF1996 domain-containing protein n=1 Tax=Sphingomonas kaistensis TaxID=298708 RepID=A0A7X6BG05_9SPHN|nr:DUF1996 domain-containing protein [Sphingomonas kaistensis]NJC04507.1 hypothetical protein [Sphingomonas kaistensis]